MQELEMPVLCGISTSTKLWAADSLTGAVVIMVIIVVERIKRSRREEVDESQLKWAVDKSKKNVKGMSRQLEEGNSCSIEKSKNRNGPLVCTHH